MNELITYLAAHGLAIGLGVLIGAAVATAWLASLLVTPQQREDNAYLDGYEAGVTEARAEANLLGYGALGKRANL